MDDVLRRLQIRSNGFERTASTTGSSEITLRSPMCPWTGTESYWPSGGLHGAPEILAITYLEGSVRVYRVGDSRFVVTGEKDRDKGNKCLSESERRLLSYERSGRLRGWVHAHSGGWSHEDWLFLLADLRSAGCWPVPEETLVQPMSDLKRQLESNRAADARNAGTGNDENQSLALPSDRQPEAAGPPQPGARRRCAVISVAIRYTLLFGADGE